MNANALKKELAQHLAPSLAADLVDEFLEIRKDCKTNTLGRAAVGKFIETVVQVLQHLEEGKYDEDPSVDHYLKTLESRKADLGDGLRICCARAANMLRKSSESMLHVA